MEHRGISIIEKDGEYIPDSEYHKECKNKDLQEVKKCIDRKIAELEDIQNEPKKNQITKKISP